MEDEHQAGEWRVPGKRCHPLYKKLAALSGEVNGLSNDKVKQRLAELGLSDRYPSNVYTPHQMRYHISYTARCSLPPRGSPEVITKRLKQHLRQEAILSEHLSPPELLRSTQHNPYRLEYLLVLDFEATCEEVNPADHVYEIIEFPVVVLNIRTLEIVSVWGLYTCLNVTCHNTISVCPMWLCCLLKTSGTWQVEIFVYIMVSENQTLAVVCL